VSFSLENVQKCQTKGEKWNGEQKRKKVTKGVKGDKYATSI
jgi:hypothetical protein